MVVVNDEYALNELIVIINNVWYVNHIKVDE